MEIRVLSWCMRCSSPTFSSTVRAQLCADSIGLRGSVFAPTSRNFVSSPSPRGVELLHQKTQCANPTASSTCAQTGIQRNEACPKSSFVPAKSLEELLEIDIVGPADPSMAKQRRTWLPTQVRNILDDADHLVTNSNASFPTTPASAPLHLAKPPESQPLAEFQSASARNLNLVRGHPTAT